MNIKKVLALFMMITMSFGLLVGCGGNDVKEQTATPKEDTSKSDAKEDDSKNNDKILVATNAEFPPFEFITEKGKGVIGEFDGIDIVIAKEIGDALGKEVQIENMEFISVIAAVTSGSVDFAIAALTSSSEKAENVDFSIPYFTATQCIIVNKDNEDIHSADDILDKKVGTMEGFTGEVVCINLGVDDLVTYKNAVSAVTDLKQGRRDAVVVDIDTAINISKQSSDLKVIEDKEAFSDEEYAIAVKKGDTELLESINEVLEGLIDSGKIGELVSNYSSEM